MPSSSSSSSAPFSFFSQPLFLSKPKKQKQNRPGPLRGPRRPPPRRPQARQAPPRRGARSRDPRGVRCGTLFREQRSFFVFVFLLDCRLVDPLDRRHGRRDGLVRGGGPGRGRGDDGAGARLPARRVPGGRRRRRRLWRRRTPAGLPRDCAAAGPHAGRRRGEGRRRRGRLLGRRARGDDQARGAGGAGRVRGPQGRAAAEPAAAAVVVGGGDGGSFRISSSSSSCPLYHHHGPAAGRHPSGSFPDGLPSGHHRFGAGHRRLRRPLGFGLELLPPKGQGLDGRRRRRDRRVALRRLCRRGGQRREARGVELGL